MIRIDRLTTVSLDLAYQLFPESLSVKNRKKKLRKQAARLRRRARLQLDRLEDRTLLSASISGTVFNDLNGSGVRVGGDPAVSGQTVYLDSNNDGHFDSTQTTPLAVSSTAITSAGAGALAAYGFLGAPVQVDNFPATFQNLAITMDLTNNSPDPIAVGVASPLGATVPNLPTLFTLNPGQTFDGTIDGNSTNPITLATGSTTITGTYAPQQSFISPGFFIDNTNPNGMWTLAFGPPASASDISTSPSDHAHTVFLSSAAFTFTEAEPSTLTDAAGNYSFTGLNPRTYQVAVALPSAEQQTAPAGGASQTVTLTDGQNLTGVDFGVKAVPDLTSVAFHLAAPPTAWGQNVTVDYTLKNEGAADAPAFNVGLYLSNTGTISSTGPLLDTLQIGGLAAGASTSGSATIQLPDSPPAGFDSLANAYVGSVIDPSNSIPETSANQSNQGAGLDLASLATPTNVAVTSNQGVQQSPSVAVDPTNPQHLVAAYMDYSLLTTGYAGIGIAVSTDGGATWTNSSIPLPTNFDQGAAAPTVAFDAQGNVYVSFMAATFLGTKPDLTNPDSTQRADGFQSNNGIFVAESSATSGKGGLSWSAPVAVVENVYSGTAVNFEAFPDLAIDTAKMLPNGQANPNFGNLYVTWTRFYAPGQFPGDSSSTSGSDVMFAVSNTSNGGTGWATQLQNVAGPGPGTGLVSAIKDPQFGTNDSLALVKYSSVTVGAGTVYVSTYTGGWYTTYFSTDGGLSTGTTGSLVSGFTAPNWANQLGFPFGEGFLVLADPTLPNDQFRTLPFREIAADPNHPGVLYAIGYDALDQSANGANSASGIVFAVSDDYGQSWSSNFTVGSEASALTGLTANQINTFAPVLNDENGGQYPSFAASLQTQIVASQAMPTLSVNAQGDITVIWYDTRTDPSGQSLEVWGTVSTDGGQHFSANFPISTGSFNPNADSFTTAANNTSFYLGDQIGLAVSGNSAYALWTDGRSGKQSIEAASFSVTPNPAAPADRFVDNNTFQTATSLGKVTVQQVLPGLALPLGGGDEWFSIQSGATGELSVSVTAATGGNALQLQLTDTSGNVLPVVSSPVLDASGAVIGQELVYPSVAGQTYLVHVSGSSTAGIQYTLIAGSLTADLGSQVQGTEAGTMTNSGQSVYRLAIDPTGSLAVTLQAASDVTGHLTLQILSADGQTVLASSPAPGITAGQSVQVNVPVTEGQVVLIEVSGDATALGDFSFQFTNFDQFQVNGVQSLFFPTIGTPTSLAAADLTGSGKTDLVVTNTNASNSVGVLLGNGDGTFQSPRQFDIGPGLAGNGLTPGNRQVAVADLTNNGIPDIIAPNFTAADMSVLIGNGDGTFQPQHIFNALPSPDATVTGDFNGDGNIDVITLENFAQGGGVSEFAVLLGRGDGTFEPPILYPTVFTQGANSMVVGDFTGNGKLDLIIFSKNEQLAQIFLGNDDGTFRNGGTFATGENTFNAMAADLNGDGKLDLITTGTNTGNIYVMLGNGDGTFQAPIAYQAMAPRPGDNVGVYGLAVVDFGSAPATDSSSVGAPDGHLDIIVTAEARSGQGGAEVIMLPGLVNSQGQYAGFGAPVVLANIGAAGPIAVGDFTGNGATDLAVGDNGGITVIYGKTLVLPTNDTPQTALNLGTVTHLVTQSQSIVSQQEDAFYILTVPTESAPGSGNEVIDFEMNGQNEGGGGLRAQVFDAFGNVLGSGASFRVVAPQGAVLTLHVYGMPGADGTPGSGSYTLDIDVLPQVVSVQAQAALPGGPATSIVITLQGDYLDPTAAVNPANYSVTWFGPDGQQGTADDQVIPIAAADGGQPVVYDPSADVSVASGLNYPKASRQTITLLFAQPLPAGSYQITLSPAIQAAMLNSNEAALLADNGGADDHSVVAAKNGVVSNGLSLVAPNLVTPAGTPNPNAITNGTPFLTQLQNDLSSLLDSLLAEKGDDPSITAAINNQILARFVPGYMPSGSESATAGPQTYAIFWLDPVSIGLQTPQQGQQVTYDLPKNTVSDTANQTYVSVGGNVEVIVVAGIAGTFNLDVSNVPSTARGGAVLLSPDGNQAVAFTDGLRAGQTAFEVTVAEGASVAISTEVSTTTTALGSEASGSTVAAVAPGNTGTTGTPVNTGTTSTTSLTTTSASEGETTGSTAVGVNSSSNFGEAVAQGQNSTQTAGLAGEGPATGTAAVGNAGSANTGTSTGSAAASSSTGAGGSSESGDLNLIQDIQKTLDDLFQQWREANPGAAVAPQPMIVPVVDAVEETDAPLTPLAEDLGGREAMAAALPWRELLHGLPQSGAALPEECFSKMVPVARLKRADKPLPATIAAENPAALEEDEMLWEQDTNEMRLDEPRTWEVREYWPALLLAAGTTHAWMREKKEEEENAAEKPGMALTADK